MNLRVEQLKKRLNLEWGEVAELLGVSRSMLNHARKGIRSFGPKTLRRLEQAEVKAGLRAESIQPQKISKDFDREEFLEAVTRLADAARVVVSLLKK